MHLNTSKILNHYFPKQIGDDLSVYMLNILPQVYYLNYVYYKTFVKVDI